MNPPSNPSTAHNNTGAPSTLRSSVRSLGLALTLLAVASFTNAAGAASDAQGNLSYVSGGIGLEMFQKIVASAASDVGVEARIIHRLSAAPDHPIGLAVPEGEYLKGLACQV